MIKTRFSKEQQKDISLLEHSDALRRKGLAEYN